MAVMDASANHASNVLPLVPVITPALGIAGVTLMLTGLVYCVIGIKHKLMYVFLSCAYLVSLGVTVLVIYLMKPPVSDAIQGAFFVAACVSGLIAGAFSVVFKPVTEVLGCFLGGFCISMWLMTLRPGGLIQSSTGTILLIVLVSLASYGVSFIPRAKLPAMIVSSAFAGATATILGIDCFSRAGLKEFWMYTWRLNRDVFPFNTNTYPLTKGIRAEIGCIPVLFACGLLSQLRFYKAIQARKDKKAADAAQLAADRDRFESEIGRQVQRTAARDRRTWEATYEEKKKPNVEQTQVAPESPSKTVHQRSQSAATAVQNKSQKHRSVEKTDSSNDTCEISPIHTLSETQEVSRTRSSSLQQEYPSLRPKSGPPPPVLPELDDSSDDVDRVTNANSADPTSVVNSLMLPLRVSPLDFDVDLEDYVREIDAPKGEEEDPASCSRTRSSGGQESYRPGSLEDQEAVFDFELVPSGDEGERNSIQKSNLAREDADQQRQEREPKPASSARVTRLPKIKRRQDRNRVSLEAAAAAAMNRTKKWAETLDQAEAVVEQDMSVRISTTNDEVGSMWSGFEGAYTNTTATAPETRSHEPTISKDVVEPIVEQSVLSRLAAVKQGRCSSEHKSPVESQAPKLPAPIKSARVHERNSSLPALRTTPTLVEQQQAEFARRHRKSSSTQMFGNSAVTTQRSPDTDPDDEMLSARRRSLQQQARTMSSGQVSTISSLTPHTPTSATAQSLANTTAITTPMTATSPHPLFVMTAHPLRGSYPSPPGAICSPVYPSPPGAVYNPAYQRRSSVPVLQPGMLQPGETLLGLVEQDEIRQQQIKHVRKVSQEHEAAATRRNRQDVRNNERRKLEIEEMMRSGKLNDAHQRALQKLQRVATRNAESLNNC